MPNFVKVTRPVRNENPLVDRSIYPYWVKERVRWSDTDMVGHVNNMSFSAYFETGRTEFLLPLIARDAERRILMVMARMAVDYIGEVHWPGDVEVGTGILAVGKSSCRMGQALFNGDRCVGSAETVLVMVDEHTRRPCEIPEWVRNYLGGFSI